MNPDIVNILNMNRSDATPWLKNNSWRYIYVKREMDEIRKTITQKLKDKIDVTRDIETLNKIVDVFFTRQGLSEPIDHDEWRRNTFSDRVYNDTPRDIRHVYRRHIAQSPIMKDDEDTWLLANIKTKRERLCDSSRSTCSVSEDEVNVELYHYPHIIDFNGTITLIKKTGYNNKHVYEYGVPKNEYEEADYPRMLYCLCFEKLGMTSVKFVVDAKDGYYVSIHIGSVHFDFDNIQVPTIADAIQYGIGIVLKQYQKYSKYTSKLGGDPIKYLEKFGNDNELKIKYDVSSQDGNKCRIFTIPPTYEFVMSAPTIEMSKLRAAVTMCEAIRCDDVTKSDAVPSDVLLRKIFVK